MKPKPYIIFIPIIFCLLFLLHPVDMNLRFRYARRDVSDSTKTHLSTIMNWLELTDLESGTCTIFSIGFVCNDKFEIRFFLYYFVVKL